MPLAAASSLPRGSRFVDVVNGRAADDRAGDAAAARGGTGAGDPLGAAPPRRGRWRKDALPTGRPRPHRCRALGPRPGLAGRGGSPQPAGDGVPGGAVPVGERSGGPRRGDAGGRRRLGTLRPGRLLCPQVDDWPRPHGGAPPAGAVAREQRGPPSLSVGNPLQPGERPNPTRGTATEEAQRVFDAIDALAGDHRSRGAGGGPLKARPDRNRRLGEPRHGCSGSGRNRPEKNRELNSTCVRTASNRS